MSNEIPWDYCQSGVRVSVRDIGSAISSRQACIFLNRFDWRRSGLTDPYAVPSRIFGSIDPELPAMIGRIVMLSALLEHQVAVLASSVARQFLKDASALWNERNEIVHRVWSKANVGEWGGHKARRRRLPSRRRRTASTRNPNWIDYGPQYMQSLIERMVALDARATDVIPLVSALTRR